MAVRGRAFDHAFAWRKFGDHRGVYGGARASCRSCAGRGLAQDGGFAATGQPACRDPAGAAGGAGGALRLLWRLSVALLARWGWGGPWVPDYLRWELMLLEELGFGLDLTSCAVTGSRDDLCYVSPKSGRAVSRAGAGEWAAQEVR